MSKKSNFKPKYFIQINKKSMKLKTLLESKEAFMLIGCKENLPPILQWKIVPLLKKFKLEEEKYDEINNSTIKKLGEKQLDANGKWTGGYKVTAENKEKYQEQMKKILDEEIELKVPEIKYSEFRDEEGKQITLPTGVLVDLEWLIKE